MNKDAQMRAAINQKLIETGERERLKELLRAKLIECGWKDQLKAHCKEVIKEKGLEHVTVDDLVAEITPKGRALGKTRPWPPPGEVSLSSASHLPDGGKGMGAGPGAEGGRVSASRLNSVGSRVPFKSKPTLEGKKLWDWKVLGVPPPRQRFN